MHFIPQALDISIGSSEFKHKFRELFFDLSHVAILLGSRNSRENLTPSARAYGAGR